MKQTCDALAKVEGVTKQIDKDMRDVTVKCWTDYFIKDYLFKLPAM